MRTTTTYEKIGNLVNVMSNSFTDALTIDVPVTFAATYALHSCNEELSQSCEDQIPKPYDIALNAVLPVIIAACTYSIRDIFRGKVSNPNIEQAGPVSTIGGGIVGGAFKYIARHWWLNPSNSQSVAATALGTLGAAACGAIALGSLGAINNALYEWSRPYTFRILDDKDLPAPGKFASLAALYAAIEGVDNPHVEGVKGLTNNEASKALTLSGYGNGWIEGGVVGTLAALAVTAINVPFEKGVNKYLTPAAAAYLGCCALETGISYLSGDTAANFPLHVMSGASSFAIAVAANTFIETSVKGLSDAYYAKDGLARAI